MKMPLPWRMWLLLLVVVNMLIPFFFLDRPEARIALGASMIGMMLMTTLTHFSGFTRLLGLGHTTWFPLIYFFWTRLAQTPADDFFGIWLRALMILNALSLIIDVADVIRYLTGDRLETIKGL